MTWLEKIRSETIIDITEMEQQGVFSIPGKHTLNHRISRSRYNTLQIESCFHVAAICSTVQDAHISRLCALWAWGKKKDRWEKWTTQNQDSCPGCACSHQLQQQISWILRCCHRNVWNYLNLTEKIYIWHRPCYSVFSPMKSEENDTWLPYALQRIDKAELQGWSVDESSFLLM